MSKQTIREQFGAQAATYTNSQVHARGASLGRLVELVQPQPEWTVLDIATGTGHTAFAFAPLVARVIATDITPQMLQQARDLANSRGLSNVTIETADAESLPYTDSAFDLVTCRIAPHHFGNIPLFLSEAARLLRRGGLLAIVDNVVPEGAAGSYVNAFEKLRDPSHGRCLSKAEWVSAIQGAGLTIYHHETLQKTLEFDFWAKRHDETMRSYLLAMLTEASGASAQFLQPKILPEGSSFTLSEGLFIAGKSEG